MNHQPTPPESNLDIKESHPSIIKASCLKETPPSPIGTNVTSPYSTSGDAQRQHGRHEMLNYPALPLQSAEKLEECSHTEQGSNKDYDTHRHDWWGRLEQQPLSVSIDSDDDVVEKSSVLAGVAERNAFAMKQQLKEWQSDEQPSCDDSPRRNIAKTVAKDSSNTIMERRDDDPTVVSLQDLFLDALDQITVTTASSSLADAIHDHNVQDVARELVEESNLQATTAEETAREMKRAIDWWRRPENDAMTRSKQDTESETNPANNDLSTRDHSHVTLTTTSQESCSIGYETRKSCEHNLSLTETTGKLHDVLFSSEQDDDDSYEIPWEDTNLMEAHLMAQEQTSAVHVLCYETMRMAELVEQIVGESSQQGMQSTQHEDTDRQSGQQFQRQSQTAACAYTLRCKSSTRNRLVYLLLPVLLIALAFVQLRQTPKSICRQDLNFENVLFQSKHNGFCHI